MLIKKDTKSAISLIVFALILAVVGWIYFELHCSNLAEKISTITGVISALAASGALFLAILVYKKFGIERRLLNRQFDLIYELVEEVSKKKFILKSADMQEGVHSFIMFYTPRLGINAKAEND